MKSRELGVRTKSLLKMKAVEQ